jgi:hypothetical protein
MVAYYGKYMGTLHIHNIFEKVFCVGKKNIIMIVLKMKMLLS